MKISLKKVAIALASATMLFAVSSATHAHAADGDSTSNDAGQAASVIDLTKDGSSSITITKLKKADNNGTVAGDGKTAPEGEPLAGAKFSLEKVTSIDGTDVSNLDYTANDTWVTVAGLMKSVDMTTVQVDSNSAKTPETTGQDGKTGENGEAKFSNLNFGIYKVTETEAPTNATPSVPFLVVLPFPSSSGADNSTAYLYDVKAFPKNSVDSITKTLSSADLTKDGTVVYTMESTIHPYADGLTRYEVSDKLDPRLKYQSVKVWVAADGQKSDANLADASTYQVVAPSDENNNTVTVKFTSFDALNNAAVDKGRVIVELTAKVQLSADGTAPDMSDLTNSAMVIPNQDSNWPTDPQNPGDKTPPPATTDNPSIKFGEIDVKKTDPDGNVLAGAKFTLQDSAGNPVTFYDPAQNKYVTEGTTGEDGILKMQGLALSTWYDGKEQTTPHDYQLVETQAPEGYARLNKPVPVTLNAATVTPVVENVNNSSFNLPSTGGAGIIASTAAGAVLVGLAGLTFAYRRKK